MKRLAGYTIVVMATLAVIFLLWQFRSVVGIFIFSLIVTAAVRPIVRRVADRGLSPPAATLVTYVAGLTILAVLLYLIGVPLLNELQGVVNTLAYSYELTYPQWLIEGSSLQEAIARRLPAPPRLYESLAGQGGGLLVLTLFGATRSFLVALGGLGIALVMSVYWTADQDHFQRLWLSLLPAAQRAQAREIWRDIETGVGSYLSSQLIQSFLAGLLLGLGYWLLGLPYTILLAVFGAVISFIPVVGAIIIAIPPLIVGLLTYPPAGVAAALYTLAVFIILQSRIEPRFFNRQRFSSLLIVLTMIPMADAFGIAGLIVAPPLAVAIQIFFNAFFNHRYGGHRYGGHLHGGLKSNSSLDIADLEARVAEMQTLLAQRDQPPSPEVTNLMARLDRLVERVQATVPEKP